MNNSPINQATLTATSLLNEGKSVYDQQMALSQSASIAGDQLTQQAKAANDNANAQAKNASNEAAIMNTTGSTGNLYQQNLTAQNTLFGYNPETLQKTQQLQNQSEGLAKTELSQLQKVQGGNRGLSAAGVEAKAQSIQTQNNQFETQLGNTIASEENNAKTANQQASNEATAQYNEEQLTEQSYTQSAAQYTSIANSYTAAAQAEYDASTTYAAEAVNNILSFEIAALSAMNAGLDASKANLDTQLANMNNSLAQSKIQEAELKESSTKFIEQEISFNDQQNSQRIAAQKTSFANYQMFVKAGISSKRAMQLTGV